MQKRFLFMPALFLLLNLQPVGAQQDPQEVSQVRATPITVARTQARPLKTTATVTGELESKADPMIAAEIDGRTLLIHVDEGDRVQAGQMLAQLDAEAYEIALEKTEADIQRLQALIKNYQRTVKRYQGLLNKQSTAQSELDKAETDLAAALAELSAATARVKEARYQLNRTKITSPITGIVQQRQVSVGDYVKKGDPLFQVVAVDQLRARLYFAESQAAQVHTGLPVRLWIGERMQTIEAIISRVRPMLNPENRALEALVDFANPGGWQPGYSVTAEVTLAVQERVVMLPVRCLVRRPAGIVVYRINGNQAHQQPVEPGRRDGDWIEITAGLGADETVALDGAGFLTDGAIIDIRNEP